MSATLLRDRCGEALGAEALGELLGLRRERRQGADRPEEQQVGQVRVADEGRAVQVGAEYPARVRALGSVAVAGADLGPGPRPSPGPEPVGALMVLDPGEPPHVQPGVDVRDYLADGAALASAAANVEQAES